MSETKQILVEYLTEPGSAFAITEEGDQVFLNQRIVERMNVHPDTVWDAHLVLNYTDKRDTIKYRAMRIQEAEEIIPVFQDD